MALQVTALKKHFDNFSLDLDFSVADGETLVLAGPSGCGKTTALNIIAGLLPQDSGSIFLDNKPLDDLPAWQRNVAVIFQDLALFPHLNVEKNLAYSLTLRHVPKQEKSAIVRRMLEIIHLSGYEKRRIHTLSGGEKQRLAIGRALAQNPVVLLLDEPFSGLDIVLRRSLRDEFREIRKNSTAPWIFVTHSSEEALALGDRIALINAGKIVESGYAKELAQHPQTEFGKQFFAGTYSE
jgi:ABC-type Fe3+/spermidine/putrescine transport system ATPase subunit